MADGPTLKTPPHSDEAELSVLGALMLNGDAWFDVAETITARDFYRPQHQIIFEAMASLAGDSEPLDAVTTANRLETVGQLNRLDGGIAYLAEIVDSTPGASNVAAYAKIVRERSDLRRLIAALHEAREKAFAPDGLSSAEVLDLAEQRVFQVSEHRFRTGDRGGMAPLLDRAMGRIRERSESDSAVTGLATGFADLDAKTAGLQSGNLVVVAGRPSMGKTSLAMNIVEHAVLGSETPAPVLVLSLEMHPDELVERLLASLGRIDFGHIRTGALQADEWTRLASAMAQLRDTPLEIQAAPKLTPTDLRARARRLAREYDELGLIVVDYLQLMDGSTPTKTENRTLELAEISRSLKALALELHCPVIAISQLNRAVEARNNKRPTLADLRDSGAIEQDADLIVFVYRDEIYDEASEDKGIAELIIGKQRNGPVGTVKVRFFDTLTKFEDLALSRYDGPDK